jgi:hypothetical protein
MQCKRVTVAVVMDVFVDHHGDNAQEQAEASALETVSTAIYDASMGGTDPVREHLTMVPVEEWFPVIKVTGVEVVGGG